MRRFWALLKAWHAAALGDYLAEPTHRQHPFTNPQKRHQ